MQHTPTHSRAQSRSARVDMSADFEQLPAEAEHPTSETAQMLSLGV